jgi:penicillin amidase
VPSENVVYADTAGNIGEHSAGLAPLRQKWTGLLPVPGDGGYEWEGFVPSSDLPHSQNPRAGFIATANHRMIPPGYAYQVGFEWAPPDRFRRIQEVLGEAARTGHHLDVADMENLQNDVVSLPARDLVRLLSDACSRPSTTAAADHSSRKPAETAVVAADASAAGKQDSPPPVCSTPTVQLLMKWDGAVTRESAAAVLYELWCQEVERAVFKRLAPESVWKLFERRRPLLVVMQYLLRPDAGAFGSHPRAARDRLLLDAVPPAVAKLTELEGPNLAGWQWGKLHQVRFRHPLDKAPGAEGLLDLGPLARPGDGSTVDATSFDPHFEQVSGASYREIMDTSDWDRSEAVNVPGQSGQPASPHYSDLLPLWAEGRYFPLVYSRPAVEKEAIDRLELVPD